MIQWSAWAIWLFVAYAAGSIPFDVLLGKARGVDLRRQGRGNLGASNAGRVLGKKYGLACFAFDVSKGLFPVLIYGLLYRPLGDDRAAAALQWLGVAVAAVMGHVYCVWLSFRGGKGVATGLGVVLGFYPVLTLPGVAAAVVWLLVVRATHYVSVASMIAAVTLPLTAMVMAWLLDLAPGQAGLFVAVPVLLAGLVVWRHRDNLARLRAGTESKITWMRRREAQ